MFFPPLIFFSVRFSDLGSTTSENLSPSQKLLTFYKAPITKFAANVVSRKYFAPDLYVFKGTNYLPNSFTQFWLNLGCCLAFSSGIEECLNYSSFKIFQLACCTFIYFQIFYVMFLLLYSYVILFDFNQSISLAEWILIGWIGTMIVEEIREVCLLTNIRYIYN